MSPRARATLGALALLLVAGCAASPLPRTPAVDPDLAQMSRLARVAYEAGALAQAVALYERALARARVLDNAAAVGDAAYNLAVCLALRGQGERAWELLREAEAEFRRAGADLADVWLVEAKVARRRGRPLEARTLAERILTDPMARPTDGHRVLVAVLEGDLACDAGGAAAARGALATARNRLGTPPDPGLQAEIARLGGRLDLLETRPDLAALAFDREAGLWQDARRYPEMARALGRAGEAYRVAGRPGRGSALPCRPQRLGAGGAGDRHGAAPVGGQPGRKGRRSRAEGAGAGPARGDDQGPPIRQRVTGRREDRDRVGPRRGPGGLHEMIAPALPANEAERLAAVRELMLLDTPREERFDRVSRLVMRLFGVPVAFVALIDADRQWFKSCFGLSVAETPREVSFCGHAILGDEALVVPDALQDLRFCDNPLVVGPPHIRFYAGHPLRGPRDHKVGTLCLIDFAPRHFSEPDRALLQDLAAVVERELNLAETLKLQEELLATRAAAERLLLNILPGPVAKRLQAGACVIADCFPDATILFADLHDFSRLTSGMAPAEVVQLLNKIFSRFDALVQQHGVEKIKTIGDAYMVAAGVPLPRADHAEAMADLALAMQQEIVRFEAPNGETFSLRIGLSSGPVVAGVIGTTKFNYDLWGETVGTASEMAAFGAPGCIQVVEATCARLRDTYLFEERGEFYVKGRGEVRTYFLRGRKPRHP